jgi:hypothetical protein
VGSFILSSSERGLGEMADLLSDQSNANSFNDFTTFVGSGLGVTSG